MLLKKYTDICEIYEILDINEEYVKVKVGNIKKYLYIFEVKPFLVLDTKDKKIFEILEKYEQFLRLLNFDFQIITRNEEIKVEEYFEIFKENNDSSKDEIIDEYMKNLEKLFNSSKIFISSHYFIISSEFEVKNVENYFQNLNTSGIKCEKISDAYELEKFLMKGVGVI